MTHSERQAYADRLMAVLQGDDTTMLITETGEIESPPDEEIEIPLDLSPWLRLTSADRRDRAALRALRAEVMRDGPVCGFPSMERRDPVVSVAILSHPDYEDVLRNKAIPEQVRQWVYTFRHIQLRAICRWLGRGPGRRRGGRHDAVIGHFCRIWTLTIWFGNEDRWPQQL
jgi:hypothetical protein